MSKTDITLTGKEYTRQHAAYLDAEYKNKWPNGCFKLQYWNDRFHVHWCPFRNVSGHACMGITVSWEGGASDYLEIRMFQNNSFGKITKYDSLEKLQRAFVKYTVPHYIQVAFLTAYAEYSPLFANKKTNEELLDQFIEDVDYD